MDTIDRLYAPITERASRNSAIATTVYKDVPLTLTAILLWTGAALAR